MSTTPTTAPSKIGGLILAWLLTRTKRDGEGGTRSALGAAFKSLLGQQWSSAEQTQVINDEIVALERARSIEFPRKGRLKLTRRGRSASLVALGMESLPDKFDWRAAKSRYLYHHVFEFAPPPAKGKKKGPTEGERLQAALLRQHYQLAIDKSPTMRQARDALVWRQLGIETNEPIKLGAVLEVLLNRVLGTTKRVPAKKALEQLVARAAGARRVGVVELKDALLRRFFSDAEGAPGATPTEEPEPGQNGGAARTQNDSTTSSPVVTPVPPEDEKRFAERVLTAARALETGRFGDNKVFISHVFRRLVDEGAVARDTDSFKARLLAAHIQGLLSLSRADMVETMKKDDVDASATWHSGAAFHFVRI